MTERGVGDPAVPERAPFVAEERHAVKDVFLARQKKVSITSPCGRAAARGPHASLPPVRPPLFRAGRGRKPACAASPSSPPRSLPQAPPRPPPSRSGAAPP